jgi:Zn finger protein HypA/HybF involved in hydrogenase expression
MGLLGLHYNGFAVDQTPEGSINERAKAASENEPMLYCPVCSRRLTERKCKLFCEQCGYYMSCADYY